MFPLRTRLSPTLQAEPRNPLAVSKSIDVKSRATHQILPPFARALVTEVPACGANDSVPAFPGGRIRVTTTTLDLHHSRTNKRPGRVARNWSPKSPACYLIPKSNPPFWWWPNRSRKKLPVLVRSADVWW